MGFFKTHTITLRRSSPTNGDILAEHKPVQMDPRVQDWQMEVGSLVPTHLYDCQTIGWTSPAIGTTDYLIDEKTGETYSVRSDVFVGIRSQQFTVTKYSGARP